MRWRGITNLAGASDSLIESFLDCVRPDLINEATLEEIGHVAVRSKQAVHQLADSFRETTGMAS